MTNQEKLASYLENILTNMPAEKKIGVFMDFDECAVNNHVVRLVTEQYINGRIDPEIEAAKADNTVKGVGRLCELYTGDSVEHFRNVIAGKVAQTDWRPGFIEFWEKATQQSIIQPFWVSLGLKEIIQNTFILKDLDLHDGQIIGDILKYENGFINGPELIIGEDEKLEAVDFFRRKGVFDRIVTLGHSSGDRHLVSAGDPGYRLVFRDKGALVEVADHIIDDWNWLKVLDFLT